MDDLLSPRQNIDDLWNIGDLWGSLSYLGYLVDRCGQTTPEVSDNPEVVWSPHFRSAAAMTFLITPYETPVTLLA